MKRAVSSAVPSAASSARLEGFSSGKQKQLFSSCCSKFSKFASVPQAELMTNGNFLAQAYTILAGLNVVVQSLSSTELLASQLNALGGAHQPRGITIAMFEVCFQLIAIWKWKLMLKFKIKGIGCCYWIRPRGGIGWLHDRWGQVRLEERFPRSDRRCLQDPQVSSRLLWF